MSVSVRINFLHWRGVIRRGGIRRKGRSLWSDKEFRWELGLVSLTATWSLEAKLHAYHLYLIFPYCLRLVVQIGGVNLFYLLEDEQSLSMGEFDRAYSVYINW